MERSEFLKILKNLEAKLTNWQNNFNQKNKGKIFLEIVKSVSLDLSAGILVTSGNNRLIGYCGPYHKCQKLQRQFKPKSSIKPVGYYWCWFGYGDARLIEKTLKEDGYSALYNVKAKPHEVENLTYCLADKLSYDTRFGDENILMTYIGSRAICTRLLHQFHGKTGRCGDMWHWIGTDIDFKQMDKVIFSYRKNAKRCNKKEIVI